MLEHCRPEDVNVDSSGIVRFLDDMKEQKLHMHSVMMLRHGKVILDISYAPWRRDLKHMTFSLNKSFTSTAVGFAVQDGLLTVEDKVIDYFPELLTNPPCENMQKMKVKHLLTMNTGHGVESGLIGDNWEKRFIHSYIEYEPGTHFLYNTTGTYMLSAILQKVTGKNLMDYLQEKLFTPLEMSDDLWSENSPTGIATGGHGMVVRIEDIAKLGQFYLQRGKWNGKQLLNEQWIQEAQTPWSDNSQYTGGVQAPDWKVGYGYQFWMCTPDHVFRGDGACGQYCVVCPDQDMVIAITSGNQDMSAVLQSIWKNVFPCVDKAGTGDMTALEERLRNPVTPTVWEEKGEQATEPVPEKSWIGTYRLAHDNFLRYDKFELGEDSITFYDEDGKTASVRMCKDTWLYSTFQPKGDREDGNMDDVAIRAARVGNQLVIDISYVSTPYEDMLYMTFSEHGIVIDGRRNIGLGDGGYQIIGYKL